MKERRERPTSWENPEGKAREGAVVGGAVKKKLVNRKKPSKKKRKRENQWSSQVLKAREKEALPPARFLFSCETACAESLLYSLDASKVPGRVSLFLSVDSDEAKSSFVDVVSVFVGNAFSLFSNDAFVVLQ